MVTRRVGPAIRAAALTATSVLLRIHEPGPSVGLGRRAQSEGHSTTRGGRLRRPRRGPRFMPVAAVMALIVSACSGTASTASPTTSSAPATSASPSQAATSAAPLPQITVLMFPGPEGDAMKASTAEYTKQTGNPVDFQLLGRDTYMQKRALILTGGGSGVDLIAGDDFNTPSFAAAGALAPIDDYINGDPTYNLADMLQGPKDAAKYNGKTYMFPTDFSTELLFYRTDLIPTPPKTWDEYLQVAKQFTKSVNPQSPTKYGTVYSGKGYISEASWLMPLWDWGGDLLDPSGKVVIDSPAAVSSLDYHLSLLTKWHVVPPETPNSEYPEIQTYLEQGLVAMASQFNAAMPDLQDCTKSPKTCGKIALTAMPAGPVAQVTGAEMLGLWMPANAPQKAAAAAYALWLTGPVGGLFYSKAGGNSPRTSIFSSPEMIKLRPWNPDLLKAMQNSRITMVNNGRESELLTILRNEINKALAGQQDAKKTLDTVAAQWRKLLGQ
jgi:multiple sugar transport system substrate-binding protein